MIDPLAMPIFKPLWEAFPYLPGCFAAWRGMSSVKYPLRPTRRRTGNVGLPTPSWTAWRNTRHEASATMLARRSSGIFPEQRRPVGESARHRLLPEMVQAVWFFGLNRLAGGTPGAVIPVLSCGGVSLQSSAYPRGLQSFHADAPARSRCSGVPGRIPWN